MLLAEHALVLLPPLLQRLLERRHAGHSQGLLRLAVTAAAASRPLGCGRHLHGRRRWVGVEGRVALVEQEERVLADGHVLEPLALALAHALLGHPAKALGFDVVRVERRDSRVVEPEPAASRRAVAAVLDKRVVVARLGGAGMYLQTRGHTTHGVSTTAPNHQHRPTTATYQHANKRVVAVPMRVRHWRWLFSTGLCSWRCAGCSTRGRRRSRCRASCRRRHATSTCTCTTASASASTSRGIGRRGGVAGCSVYIHAGLGVPEHVELRGEGEPVVELHGRHGVVVQLETLEVEDEEVR